MKAPNNIFKNWKKVCYIRQRVWQEATYPMEVKYPSSKRYVNENEEVYIDEYGNELERYYEPKKYLLNYQPVTNDADEANLKPYGITLEGTVKALMDAKYFGELNRYDLAYLYDATPFEEEYAGQYANYRVITAIPQNMKILVYFERLTKN